MSPAVLASEPFVLLPIPELRLPNIDEALRRNPDVRRTESYLVESSLSLEQAVAGDEPVWTADASYGFTYDRSSGVVGHELAAGLTGALDNTLVRAGVSASLDDPSVGFSFGLAWSLPDNEARESRLALLEHDASIAAIGAEQTRLGIERSIVESQFALREMEIRAHQLERMGGILAREREVTGRAVEAGLSGRDALLELEWALEDLAFDNYDLLFDRLLLALDMESLVAPPDIID